MIVPRKISLEICYLKDIPKTETNNAKIEFLLDHGEILLKLQNSFLKGRILCPVDFTPQNEIL